MPLNAGWGRGPKQPGESASCAEAVRAWGCVLRCLRPVQRRKIQNNGCPLWGGIRGRMFGAGGPKACGSAGLVWGRGGAECAAGVGCGWNGPRITAPGALSSGIHAPGRLGRGFAKPKGSRRNGAGPSRINIQTTTIQCNPSKSIAGTSIAWPWPPSEGFLQPASQRHAKDPPTARKNRVRAVGSPKFTSC